MPRKGRRSTTTEERLADEERLAQARCARKKATLAKFALLRAQESKDA